MSWRLARSLDALSDEIRARWPGTTIWTIGDADHRGRGSDHNPNPDGVVCAVDVVGRDIAARLWDELRASRDPRIKYLIFDRQIVSATTSPWQVRHYSGSNPHADHIHVSVGRGSDGRSGRADLYDDPGPWGIGGPLELGDRLLALEDPYLRGPDVKAWQRRLNGRGHDLKVDGVYGTVTEEATRDAQRAAGVSVDGVVGPQTLAAVQPQEDTVNSDVTLLYISSRIGTPDALAALLRMVGGRDDLAITASVDVASAHHKAGGRTVAVGGPAADELEVGERLVGDTWADTAEKVLAL